MSSDSSPNCIKAETSRDRHLNPTTALRSPGDKGYKAARWLRLIAGMRRMMGFPLLDYLSKRGYLRNGTKILDIGSQNLMNCTIEGMTDFIRRHGREEISAGEQEEIARLHYFSTPRRGERTLFLSEFLAMTNIEYRAVDVCPAPSTDIVDLNWAKIADNQRGAYDVVLNLGTTEHILGQINSMAYIHDASKVGGIILHQPPSAGWVNHGYFAYHPQFYYDVAKANGYLIDDIWYSQSTVGPFLDDSIEFRDASRPLGIPILPDEITAPKTIPYYNLNVVMRKVVDGPFKIGLELATSHSAIDENIQVFYSDRTQGSATKEDIFAAVESARQSLSKQQHDIHQMLSKQQHSIHQMLSRQIYETTLSRPVQSGDGLAPASGLNGLFKKIGRLK
jgi:hypothetical protein